MNYTDWYYDYDRMVPVSYMDAEIETLVSGEASYYFVRHPEKTYSLELWFHIKKWLLNVVCIENECPYIDINVVDDCIDDGIKELKRLKERKCLKELDEEYSGSLDFFIGMYNGDKNGK